MAVSVFFAIISILILTQFHVHSVTFGRDFLKYYEMDENYMNLNFGSYGLPPIQVLQNQTAWRQIMESCPDCWFRYNVTPYLNSVQQSLAKYLNIADWNDLVFTLNASHGVNAVLRSIADELYKQCITQQTTKCKILYFNTAYGMVINTLDYMVDIFGDQLEMVEFTVTTQMFSNSTLLLEELNKFLIVEDALNKIYLSSISHITSKPAMIFDIKSITQLMRQYNIITLVDAAHAMGQIKVDINDIDPDIYLSNGHKWLYSPRGSSILYVKKSLQNIVYPTCISDEGHGNTQFQKWFNYQGTNDHTAWLSMASAIQFREEICGGNDNIIQYIHNLCVDVKHLLVNNLWNTSALLKYDNYYGALINIQMPTNNLTQCSLLQDLLYENNDHNQYYTWVPTFEYDDKCYVRLSCQIFNQLSDYQWFGDRVLDILSSMK